MITATVRYKLPPHIDHDACREHFHKIAPGFQQVQGLISKHFIWSESGWSGGVYQWQTLADAKAFYTGPWLDGIVERYGRSAIDIERLRARWDYFARLRSYRGCPGGDSFFRHLVQRAEYLAPRPVGYAKGFVRKLRSIRSHP